MTTNCVTAFVAYATPIANRDIPRSCARNKGKMTQIMFAPVWRTTIAAYTGQFSRITARGKRGTGSRTSPSNRIRAETTNATSRRTEARRKDHFSFELTTATTPARKVPNPQPREPREENRPSGRPDSYAYARRAPGNDPNANPKPSHISPRTRGLAANTRTEAKRLQ